MGNVSTVLFVGPEQGLLLTGSTAQHMASRNGLACHTLASTLDRDLGFAGDSLSVAAGFGQELE